MNLFVFGLGPSAELSQEAGQAALDSVTRELPYFTGERSQTWTAPSGAATVAWIQHSHHQTAGVDYVRTAGDRVVLYSGRPYIWLSDDEADGRSVLDARIFLQAPDRWSDRLDGRCTALSYDDRTRTLVVYSDPTGAYPVYATEIGTARWISNSVAVLRRLRQSSSMRPEVLASFFAAGWSWSDQPLWSGVDRLQRGALHKLVADGSSTMTALAPLADLPDAFSAGANLGQAASTLVAATAALGDWPGRPNVVSATGGKDSRLVVAAAHRAGIDFVASTLAFPWQGGHPDTEEVHVARRFCDVLGVPHRTVPIDPGRESYTDPGRVARLMDLLSPGTVSYFDAMTIDLSMHDQPLEMNFSGLGGELGRALYGLGNGSDPETLANQIYRRTVHRWPPLLTPEGEAAAREVLRRWVDEQLASGTAPVDILDAWYLRRIGSEFGQGMHEYFQDATSPLWSRRLLRHQLGLKPHERQSEAFHRGMIERLAPELLDVPFERSQAPWQEVRGTELSRRAAHLRRIARKARGQARGVIARHVTRPALNRHDPLPRVLTLLAEHVGGAPDHAAWAIVDRRRVERLVNRDPRTVDARSRNHVWRLATIFLAEPRA